LAREKKRRNQQEMFISNENVLSFFIGGEINVEVFLRSAKSIIRVKIIVFLTIECIIEKYSSIMFKDEKYKLW
jgi:hypothetical protein